MVTEMDEERQYTRLAVVILRNLDAKGAEYASEWIGYALGERKTAPLGKYKHQHDASFLLVAILFFLGIGHIKAMDLQEGDLEYEGIIDCITHLTRLVDGADVGLDRTTVVGLIDAGEIPADTFANPINGFAFTPDDVPPRQFTTVGRMADMVRLFSTIYADYEGYFADEGIEPWQADGFNNLLSCALRGCHSLQRWEEVLRQPHTEQKSKARVNGTESGRDFDL